MSRTDVISKDKINIFKMVVSTFVAVVSSLGFILLFALFIKWFDLSDSLIKPINIVIKIISIAIGVIIATRDGKLGIKKGAIIGASYVILCYLVFSALLGSFSLNLSNLWDILFGIISGGILGAIFVNLKK